MKKLSKILRPYKLTLTMVLLLLSAFVMAAEKPVGLVDSVTGNVFVNRAGKIFRVRKEIQLEVGDELTTTMGSQVTFSNYFNQTFHLAAGSEVALSGKRNLELKKGFLWSQSKEHVSSLIMTPNSTISYEKGEGVTSFDPHGGRTQLLVINGEFKLSNLYEGHKTQSIKDGEFSFIDSEYESGFPRKPTLIGYKSYRKVTSLFTGVTPLGDSHNALEHKKELLRKKVEMDKAPARDIASLDDLDEALSGDAG